MNLVEVIDSGRALLLRDGEGTEFTLAIDAGLRASLLPRRSETKMTSSLRPRDIQNRIRSGESPESVAELAGTTVDAIMSYVAPVVAEREHVAATAQRASLRRGPGEPPTTPPLNRRLADAVEGHLRSLGADPADVTWDAYRRETGRWVLTADYSAPGRAGNAKFIFDAPGNYALTDNDDARWLIGDLATPEPAAAPMDDLTQVRERRLQAASAPELPLGGGPADHLGEDAVALVEEPVAPEPTLTFDEPLRATAPEPEPAAEEPAAQQAEEAPRRPAPKKRGRASVPSWDEIMFGPTGD
ncbi:septation protein SepH [Nocardioides montaniterrae]